MKRKIKENKAQMADSDLFLKKEDPDNENLLEDAAEPGSIEEFIEKARLQNKLMEKVIKNINKSESSINNKQVN
jgi:hypothetical protein